MSEFAPSHSVNPWDEGPYRIHGFAVPAPDGDYWPAYLIERVQGIADAPQVAVKLHEVEVQTFATEELAKMMAVSYGVNRVRNQDGLDC